MTGSNLRHFLRCRLAGVPFSGSLTDAAVAQATAHRLGGTLYHMEAPVGHAHRAQLEAMWLAQAATHLRRTRLLARLWPVDAPAPLIFKGADLAENLYRDPGARRMSDLDLLLPVEAAERVIAALLPQAERHTEPRGERLPDERPYELGLHFPDGTLELHRAPQPVHRGGPDAAGLLRRASPGRLEGLAVRFPTPLDRVLLFLVNLAKGSFHSDLADWVDLCLLLRALPGATPFADLAEAAAVHGLERPWRLAVRRLAQTRLYDGPLPAVPRADDRLVAALLPDVDEPPVRTPAWRFQAIKIWLAADDRRVGIVARGLRARSRERR